MDQARAWVLAGRALVLAGVVAAVTATAAYAAPAVTVEPDSGLTDGAVVQVRGDGFTPGKTLVIVQCVQGAQGQDGCNTDDVVFTQADASGQVDEPFTVRTGEVGGGGGRCDADHDCVINVSEPTSDPNAERASATISFAPSATTEPGDGAPNDAGGSGAADPTSEAATNEHPTSRSEASSAPDDMPDTGNPALLVPLAALVLATALAGRSTVRT